MMHPLQWEAEPAPDDVLVPIDVSALEEAAKFAPYEDEDGQIEIGKLCNSFWRDYDTRAKITPLVLQFYWQNYEVDTPVRVHPSYGARYAQDMPVEFLEQGCQALKTAGWLLNIYTFDDPHIGKVIEEIQLPYVLTTGRSDAISDLKSGLWAEFCLRPPVSDCLTEVAPRLLCPIPGTKLFEYEPGA